MAHMVWGGGLLFKLGALDFAGGTVVHIASGVSALVVALVMGKRVAGHHVEPHDVPMTVLGAGLLWFGWFGFNAGSALAANGLAAQALMVTTVAAAAGTLTWVGASVRKGRKVSVVGAAAGAVAGLVAITPAAGFVTVGGALVIGLVVGGLCFGVTLLRDRLAIDDALDVFAVHGVGGMWGAIGVGHLRRRRASAASPASSRATSSSSLIQLVAVVFTVVFASVDDLRHHQGHRRRARPARRPTSTRRPASTSPSTARPPTCPGPARPPASAPAPPWRTRRSPGSRRPIATAKY